MSTLLLIDGQQAGPFSDSQLREMWKGGRITSETLFWREGMSDWLPLSNILSELEGAPQPVPPPVPKAKPEKKKSGCFSLSLKVLLGLFGVSVVASVLVPRTPGDAKNTSSSTTTKKALPEKTEQPSGEDQQDKVNGELAGETAGKELLLSGGNRPTPAGVKLLMDARMPTAKPKNAAAWRKGFESGLAKVWDAKWEEDNKKIEAVAGKAPSDAEAKTLVKMRLKKVLNDPESVQYVSWTGVQYTEYRDGKYAWCITTEYRAKNAFGGTVPGKSTGYFRNKQLIAFD